ncbi:MAG: dehydrogenase [Actinobacteria bacterium]|nr:dehydrogenase [Actinomycetota bacterium]
MSVDPSLPGRLDALAAGWTALSRLLLSPPSDDTLAQVRNPALLDQWPLSGGTTDRGKALLLQSAEAGEDAGAVERDFARLFVGPAKLTAPPWESVHRSRERLLFEAETFQVREWYARYGLEAPRLNREPDDHIALELEFLATLAERALTALEEDREEDAQELVAAHQAFLAEHVLPWAPGLMDQIRDNAETFFLRGVAELGSGALTAAEFLLPR